MTEYALIEPKNLKELRSKLVNARGIIIVDGGNEIINRFCLENNNVNILLNPEKNTERDFMHSRNSGLNHILCKIAGENNKAIGINFNYLLDMNEHQRIAALGRIMQNVRLCRKYSVKVHIANIIRSWNNERSAKDLKSFGTLLGLNIKEQDIIKIRL